MKQHPFDPVSFFFGIFLLVMAGVAVFRQDIDWNVGVWVLPAAVLVLGSETADVLFEDGVALGRMVRIRGFPYRIIGVLEERGSMFGQSLDNLHLADILGTVAGDDTILVIPRSTKIVKRLRKKIEETVRAG